jgi:predicted DNA-binding WGR domain protein
MSGPVKTRSFFSGNQFWEISWDGRFVEVTSGKLGASGRASERAFRSEAECVAFVEARVRERLEKGYREGDPARVTTPDPVDPFQRDVEAWSRKLRQASFFPVLDETDAGRPDGCQFGGAPWLASADDWPPCGRCGEPMHFLLQLRRDDVPEPFRRVFASDLVPFFLCDRECQAESGWEPFAPGTCVRHRVVKGPGATTWPAEPQFPVRYVRGWREESDYPGRDEVKAAVGDAELGTHVAGALFERGDVPKKGDKLSACADWIQSADLPTCRACRRAMVPFFQVESNRAVPVQFGDVGAGWLFACRACPELTFTWQCG